MSLPAYISGTVTTHTDPTAGKAGTETVSVDVGSSGGSNRALVAISGAIRAAGASAFATVASATYGGRACVVQQLASHDTITNRSDLSIITCLLDTPSALTGANDLVLTYDNASDSRGIIAAAFSNCDQTTLVDVKDGGTNSDVAGTDFDDLTMTTTQTDTLVVYGTACDDFDTTWTPEGSGIELAEYDTGNNATDDGTGSMGYYPAAATGTYTDAATPSTSERMAGVIIAIRNAGEDISADVVSFVNFIGL